MRNSCRLGSNSRCIPRPRLCIERRRTLPRLGIDRRRAGPRLCEPCDRTSRSGFTLIELLVAISIFIILATITLGAFKGVTKDDRISAGAQQVKGWFEHAKSLAIHARQPRGIRFLPDANNPRLCTSIVYLGQAGYDEGDLKNTVTTDRKYIGCSTNGLLIAPQTYDASNSPLSTSNATQTDWTTLISSGALSTNAATFHGLRIEIPKGSGMWYPISAVTSGTPNILTLATPLRNASQYLSQPLDYRLELGPTALTDDAHALPSGVVIDLDASWIPAAWRPGSSPTGQPYPDQMDVMISPRGTFTGQLPSAQGIMHLCISTQVDADAARIIATHPANVASPVYPFVLADPTTTQKVVSVFLTSGRVSSSEMYVGNGDTDATPQNERAGLAPLYTDVYAFALRGKEAK